MSLQESVVIEVPRLKDIPTDVTANLQDRLNGVTDVLSRVSKLVCEDLEKAVSSAVGQDKDGNPPVLLWIRIWLQCIPKCLLGCSQASVFSPGSPQDKRPILAVVPSPAAPCHPGVKGGLSACMLFTQFLVPLIRNQLQDMKDLFPLSHYRPLLSDL